MENYQRVKKLGEGGFGQVYLVLDRRDTTKYVMKDIPLDGLSNTEIETTMKEVTMLREMRHPNIISYHEYFMTKSKQTTRMGEIVSRRLHIVMSYADKGDLEQLIKDREQQRRPFTEDEVLDLFVQICLGLKHIHDRKIIHRDIKAQNVFLSSTSSRGSNTSISTSAESNEEKEQFSFVKLGDFGIAKAMAHTHAMTKTMVGTPYYLSPEICLNRPYDHKSDIWALGVILYQLMCFRLPFLANDLDTLLDAICKTSPPSPSKESYSRPLRSLLARLLFKDPLQRPNVNSILQLSIVRDRISKFLSASTLQEEFSHTVIHSSKRKELSDAAARLASRIGDTLPYGKTTGTTGTQNLPTVSQPPHDQMRYQQPQQVRLSQHQSPQYHQQQYSQQYSHGHGSNHGHGYQYHTQLQSQYPSQPQTQSQQQSQYSSQMYQQQQAYPYHGHGHGHAHGHGHGNPLIHPHGGNVRGYHSNHQGHHAQPNGHPGLPQQHQYAPIYPSQSQTQAQAHPPYIHSHSQYQPQTPQQTHVQAQGRYTSPPGQGIEGYAALSPLPPPYNLTPTPIASPTASSSLTTFPSAVQAAPLSRHSRHPSHVTPSGTGMVGHLPQQQLQQQSRRVSEHQSTVQTLAVSPLGSESDAESRKQARNDSIARMRAEALRVGREQAKNLSADREIHVEIYLPKNGPTSIPISSPVSTPAPAPSVASSANSTLSILNPSPCSSPGPVTNTPMTAEETYLARFDDARRENLRERDRLQSKRKAIEDGTYEAQDENENIIGRGSISGSELLLSNPQQQYPHSRSHSQSHSRTPSISSLPVSRNVPTGSILGTNSGAATIATTAAPPIVSLPVSSTSTSRRSGGLGAVRAMTTTMGSRKTSVTSDTTCSTQDATLREAIVQNQRDAEELQKRARQYIADDPSLVFVSNSSNILSPISSTSVGSSVSSISEIPGGSENTSPRDTHFKSFVLNERDVATMHVSAISNRNVVVKNKGLEREFSAARSRTNSITGGNVLSRTNSNSNNSSSSTSLDIEALAFGGLADITETDKAYLEAAEFAELCANMRDVMLLTEPVDGENDVNGAELDIGFDSTNSGFNTWF